MKKTGNRRASTREPSKASLREIPEVSADAVDFGRGPAGLKRAQQHFRAKRGRPKAGEKAEGSSPRSVRLPDATWEALEERAKARRTSVHALLREAVAKLLKVKAA
jgi:Ribbon-helix-helix protein, copG family